MTGQTLETYFRQHIFEPLGMRDTSFLLSDDTDGAWSGHMRAVLTASRSRSASSSRRMPKPSVGRLDWRVARRCPTATRQPQP